MVTRRLLSILGFGDSLTAGTPGYDPYSGHGDIRSQYGFWILERAKADDSIEVVFTNRGVPGELAKTMPPRLRSELERYDYDIVIVLAGSNDIGWGYATEDISKNLEELWSIGLKSCDAVIACTIPPIGSVYPMIQEKQLTLNEVIRATSDEEDRLWLADIYSELSDERGLLRSIYDSGDGLHLSIEGYRRIGTTIWEQQLSSIV